MTPVIEDSVFLENVPITDGSGTIVAANTNQLVFQSDPLRKGFTIQNQSSQDLWVSEEGPAV